MSIITVEKLSDLSAERYEAIMTRSMASWNSSLVTDTLRHVRRVQHHLRN